MGKYTVSPHRIRRGGAALLPPLLTATALALLAGCAATSAPRQRAEPEHSVAVEAPPVIETEAIEPVNSTGEARAVAGDLSLREEAPLRYVVKRGDTLWGISNYFLRDPWQWPELWYVNNKIANPHLIYPGEVLTLVMVNGHPRLARESDLSLERLSPRVRVEPLDNALPVIPVDAIRNFLRGPRMVTLEEARKAPYVVEFTGEHIAAAEANGIFVKGLPLGAAASGVLSWAVVQIGEAYRDPDSKELLGYEAIPAGEAELRKPGPIAEMTLTKSTREVLIGDRLLPIEPEDYGANFYPHAPKDGVDGRIISVFDGLTQISQYQIVAINRGSDRGVDVGTVLQINQNGRVVADPYGGKPVTLPDQYAGLLLVFKVSPRLSYALVMKAERPIHVLDKVLKPEPSLH